MLPILVMQKVKKKIFPNTCSKPSKNRKNQHDTINDVIKVTIVAMTYCCGFFLRHFYSFFEFSLWLRFHVNSFPSSRVIGKFVCKKVMLEAITITKLRSPKSEPRFSADSNPVSLSND